MRDHVPPVRPVTDDAGSGALSGRRMRRAKPAKHVRRPRLKRYRIGRFMSGLLGMMGLIAAIGGLVSAGANVMLVVLNTPNAALSILATSPLVAGGLIAIACVLILLGQMANATFDAAAAGARMSVAGEEHDGA